MLEDFSVLGLLLSLCSHSAGERHQPWQWCFTPYTSSSFALSDEHVNQRNSWCLVLYGKDITHHEVQLSGVHRLFKESPFDVCRLQESQDRRGAGCGVHRSGGRKEVDSYTTDWPNHHSCASAGCCAKPNYFHSFSVAFLNVLFVLKACTCCLTLPCFSSTG